MVVEEVEQLDKDKDEVESHHHSKVKPENLLPNKDGSFKVSDFGLNAFSDEHVRQDGPPRAALLLTCHQGDCKERL
ncbi:hypothetical protein RIF29_07398 [Crotalaria pallida]|uniref:Protein kinase domain-containing protein n=1 Tax=Crotalaria pallida TaxID=3830 RepID=A0AAN9J4Z8_CROPI